MASEITDAEVRQAQIPHNVFISGLFVFDLLMTPAVIVLGLGMAGLLVPLLCSCALVAYIFLHGKNISSSFVAAHWKIAYKHGVWLLAGYAISAGLIFIAWLLSLNARDANMGHILWTALTRIALLPTLIAVMVTAVAEAGAISSATKREALSEK